MKPGLSFLSKLCCFVLAGALLVALPLKAIQTDKKAKTQLTQKHKHSPSHRVVSAATELAVVPLLDISLLPLIPLPLLSFAFPLIPCAAKVFTNPLFRLSYWENTFCHHIAINAP